MCNLADSLFMFTPNLRRYVNFDKRDSTFIIRETLTDDQLGSQQAVLIPQYLMNPSKEEPLEIMKRFKWINNESFLICSDWGLEQIIEVVLKGN